MKLNTIRGTRHQVLVGLLGLGPYTWFPHSARSTLDFYREMAADGLVVEERFSDGRSQFSVVRDDAIVKEVRKESARVLKRLRDKQS